MDNLLATAHQSKASKKTRSKKKPIKVVYISNPMKVKTSASEFRALVQELTGKDARLPKPNKFIDTQDVGGNQTVLDATKVVGDIDHHHHHHHNTLEVPEEQQEISDFSLGSFDDVLMPQKLENIPGFLPSSLCCESSRVNAM